VKCKGYSLVENKDKIVGCKWVVLTKHAKVLGLLFMTCPSLRWKRWKILCKILCPFEKYDVVCPKGPQVYFGPNNQTNG